MIYDDLKVLLLSLTDDHEVQVFDNVVATLEKYGATNYMDVFNLAVGDNGVDNATAMMDTLRGSLRTILEFMLGLHGVSLKEECLLTEHQVVLDALFDVGVDEDKSAILAILSAEPTPAEVFAALVAHASTYSAENVLAWVETVDDAFGARFQERLLQEEVVEPEEFEDVRVQVETYARFKSMIGGAQLFTDMFFAERATLGLPLARYAALYSQSVELDVVPLPDVAKELYAGALISEDGHGNPLQAVAAFVPQFYSDLRAQTALTVELGKLDQRFSGVRNG